MIQVALVGVSLCLIVLGVKGFTQKGLALSKTKTLTGAPAMLVGVFCILGGLGLIPLFFLVVAMSSR